MCPENYPELLRALSVPLSPAHCLRVSLSLSRLSPILFMENNYDHYTSDLIIKRASPVSEQNLQKILLIIFNSKLNLIRMKFEV